MRLFFLVCALALTARAAVAQQMIGIPGVGTTSSRSRELVNNKDWHLVGDVEIEMKETTLFADELWYYTDARLAVASGNVLYTQGNNRISAERIEMNTETRLGTFYGAWGFASIQPQRSPVSASGFVAPQMTGQDTDVYFFGEKVEKIGPKKYRITNGGFTTCVQPSPRWDLHAGTVILNIDDYTLLRNAIFNVKNVPVFYLPILYYPTKEDGRATGFLLPTYGTSTLRGQRISNAFFWAINRSQDATFMHDWFSRTGQGWGSEYRYASLGGDGSIRGYLLDQHENTLTLSSGASILQPAKREFEIRGGAYQRLPGNFHARARVDYFSSVEIMQTFHSSPYDTSRNSRSYGGNLTGSWRSYALNATFDRSEYFSGVTSSVLTGNAPRVTLTRSERPLYRNSAAYVSASGEFVQYDRGSRSGTSMVDTGLGRFDFNPQIRVPFKRWQWFTVNSSATWRNTFYTRSLSPVDGDKLVDENLNRQFVTLMAQAVGPTFNRVWNTPDSGYAERVKHTIEPFLTVQQTSAIDNFKRILRTDAIDSVVGNATSYTYGVNNRIYAKRRLGETSQAVEILNVELRQSYYSDKSSAQFDQQYTTTFNSAAPSHFSPVSLAVRAAPAAGVLATLRAEFDSRYYQLRTTSVSGTYSWTSRLQTSVGWSRRFLIKGLPGFSDPSSLDHHLTMDSRANTANNRFGGHYSMSYDVLRSTLLQQRITAFYNAQCCGIAFEYQAFSYPVHYGLPSDHRFFMSFTLAGLGNFSPFGGALANVPR